MSLTRLAMRIAAVRALTGATLAEDRVFDSAIDPVDVRIKAHRAPIIVVTTDEDSGKPDGRDLNLTDREVALVIEISVATATRVASDDIEFVIPGTDEGLDALLDLTEWNVTRRLTTDEAGWPRAFMMLVPRIMSVASKRGVNTEGVRFAARQLILICDAVSEPPRGAPVDPLSAWGVFLAQVEATPDLVPMATLLRSLIEDPARPDWKRAAEAIGITEAGAEGIGIRPYDLTTEDDGETLVEIGVNDPSELTIVEEE